MPVKSRLRELAARIDEPIEAGVERAANMVADVARQIAPYDATNTNGPHLNESIEVQDGDKPTERRVVAGVGLPDERGPAQEYGTIYMDPQPYLRPAQKQIDVQKEVKAEIQAWIKQFRV
jgi:HK97 gp10 family phage protein